MSGQRLVRLRVEGDEITHEETLLRGVGRIREVVADPEGNLWIAIDGGTRWEDGPPTKVYRLEPAGDS